MLLRMKCILVQISWTPCVFYIYNMHPSWTCWTPAYVFCCKFCKSGCVPLLSAPHEWLLSAALSASQVTDLGKSLCCLIIAESYAGDYSSEQFQACMSAPPGGVLIRNSAPSLLIRRPAMDHRPRSSCLLHVVYVKEFLRFLPRQHLENNVRNQKQIYYF